MKRTPDEFKVAVTRHEVDQWVLRGCSICGASLHYHFIHNGPLHLKTSRPNIFPHFDGNCDCTQHQYPMRLTRWDDVANYYNGLDPEGWERQAADKLFHFTV